MNDTSRLLLRCLAPVVLLTTFASSVPASAGDEIVTIRNQHPMSVKVELYSASRQYAWPGNGDTWTLKDKEAKEIPIACQPQETICYGAWMEDNRDVAWGIGPDRDQPCDNCCFQCTDDGAVNLDLDEE